jgi:hypothetical protein
VSTQFPCSSIPILALNFTCVSFSIRSRSNSLFFLFFSYYLFSFSNSVYSYAKLSNSTVFELISLGRSSSLLLLIVLRILVISLLCVWWTSSVTIWWSLFFSWVSRITFPPSVLRLISISPSFLYLGLKNNCLWNSAIEWPSITTSGPVLILGNTTGQFTTVILSYLIFNFLTGLFLLASSSFRLLIISTFYN